MSQDIYVVIEHIQGEVSDISYIMAAAAKDLAKHQGGNTVGVLLGSGVEHLKDNLALDRVIYCDHAALKDFSSDAWKSALIAIFEENSPRAVFFGNTTIGADICSSLSTRLDFPIISSCIKISDQGFVTSQICGGKIMTDSQLSEKPTIISMIPGGYKPEEGQGGPPGDVSAFAAPSLDDLKTKLVQYIEPDTSDVDISQEKVLVAIGRGIQTEDNVELAEELAELLGGTVCASRPVIDQGWLPTSRLVGKSGKSVKPDLYLSLGISGATEHLEGITGSNTIVAVNSDPDAPIFDLAKYGIEVDLFDLIDPLLEKIEAAKNG
jgi:electron transfer flavoprotein alpha subunit